MSYRNGESKVCRQETRKSHLLIIHPKHDFFMTDLLAAGLVEKVSSLNRSVYSGVTYVKSGVDSYDIFALLLLAQIYFLPPHFLDLYMPTSFLELVKLSN
jgi:hypothetical protein